jgi:predicted nucleic acid-binding protein
VKAFFDSNVAVYAFADDDDRRKSVAMDLLARHGRDCELIISTQVLLETYNVLVRKKGLLPARALAYVRMLTTYEVVTPSATAALVALTLAAEHGLPAYDAFIVQAALEGGCDTLYSEDLQAGRRFGTLVVVNPFDTAAHEPAPTYAAAPKTAQRAAPARKRKA